jgi:hypothetical protein
MRYIAQVALISLILSFSGLQARAAETPTPASTALALAISAQNLPATQRIQSTQACLSIVLLTKFDRILPADISLQEMERLARIFLIKPADETEQLATAKKLPPADSLTFDGTKLAGGNFRNIDSIMGMTGRPIALDRELPASIIPLTPAAAQGLQTSRKAFASSPKSEALADLTNRIYQSNVSSQLAADGIFCRPYAGRIDDLYHHLAQNGTAGTLLDYFALLDSLPPRQYSPISGTASRDTVPPSRVNLSDVLSGGSLRAIQKFRIDNPRANIINPFKGFAIRVLPFLADPLQKASPGVKLEASRDNMRRAISDPRRFTPTKVPALFNDPSRFLGWNEDPRYIRVSKKKKPSSELFSEIQKIDFDTPLPEMFNGPAGNELLKKNTLTASKEDAFTEVDSRSILRDLGLPQPTPFQQKRTPSAPASSTSKPPLEKPAPPVFEPELPASIADTVSNLPSATPEPTQTPKPPRPPVAPSAIAVVEEPPAPSSIPATLLAAIATPTPQPTPSPLETPAPVAKMPAATPTPILVAEKPQPSETLDFITSAPAEAVNRPSSSRSTQFQVAVLAPTAQQAVDYLKKIAASDQSLSKNVYETNRAECLIRWLGDAVKPFEPTLTESNDSADSQKLETLIREARDQMVNLLKERDTLKASRLDELKSRAAARKSLEYEIQTTRRDQLSRLTGIGA